MVTNGKKFKNIYEHKAKPSVIDSDSDVKQDESLTISQIISLHLRGIPAPVKIYDGVDYEIGDSNYSNEQLNEDYYELENDLSDFNHFTDSSNDLRDDTISPVETPPQPDNVFLDKEEKQSSSMATNSSGKDE